MLPQRQPVATASSYLPHFYPARQPYHPHHHGHPGSVLDGYMPIALHGPQDQQFALQRQQHQQQQQQQQHHHRHQQQQPLAAPAGYESAGFRGVQRLIPHRPRGTLHHPRHHPTMAYPPQITEDDLAELQKLSADYEPEVTGPLVGLRQSSNAITNEYAAADPVYQQKTAALPQKYSHYRTVRGDGRCGWRAVGFAFLERLLSLGDPANFIEQETRLRSLSNVLNAAGFQTFLYEDFADELFALMRNLGQALGAGNGDAALLDAFNDEAIQNCVITHLRTLTAAWMKTRPDDYVNYTPNLNVDQYCNDSILPMGAEIDHLGLSALNDVLLAPAGVGLEVLYLDRTPGVEVNVHRFEHASHNGFLPACVRLLYRPGHYDILYKLEDVPPPIATVPTFFQFGSHTHNEPVYDLDVSDLMTVIPGMSFATPQQGWLSASSYGAASDFFPTPTPAQPCAQPLSTPTAVPAPPPPQMQVRPVYVPPQPVSMPPPPTQMPQDLTVRTVPHSVSQAVAFPQHPGSGHPFRSSHWELEPDFVQATSHVPFQTAIFRNSHFNTAHFLNPDFQPEEWSPDAEYITSNSKAPRHRSSG